MASCRSLGQVQSSRYIRVYFADFVFCPETAGQPHAASTDMIFKGYSIPKDTVLIANVWCVLDPFRHTSTHPRYLPLFDVNQGDVLRPEQLS